MGNLSLRCPSGSDRRPRLGLNGALLGREAVRLAAAFGIYLLLGPLWRLSGCPSLYGTVVLGAASAIFLPRQHFPVLGTLGNLELRNLDALFVFALALFAVSWNMPWRRRIARFGVVLGAVVVWAVAAVILEVEVRMCQELLDQQRLQVLLPLEFRVVERAKYLVYDVGVELGPFVLLALTAWWNGVYTLTGTPAPRKRGLLRHRVAWVGIGLVVLAASFGGWRAWRESHPQHVAAHARLGRIYLEHGSLRAAEEQYRIALARGSKDPQAHLDLAGLVARRGERGEAALWLRRGLSATQDPAWRQRLGDALAGVEASTPRSPSPGS